MPEVIHNCEANINLISAARCLKESPKLEQTPQTHFSPTGAANLKQFQGARFPSINHNLNTILYSLFFFYCLIERAYFIAKSFLFRIARDSPIVLALWQCGVGG